MMLSSLPRDISQHHPPRHAFPIEGFTLHRHLATAPRVSKGGPAILTTPSSPPRRRSVESCGMPPSIRLAGFKSRCTHDILFLLQAGTKFMSDPRKTYCCMRSHPPICHAHVRLTYRCFHAATVQVQRTPALRGHNTHAGCSALTLCVASIASYHRTRRESFKSMIDHACEDGAKIESC